MGNEAILNHMVQRYRLNSKKKIGAIAELLNEIRPNSVEEWEAAYKERYRDDDELMALGDELFEKRDEMIKLLLALTPEDCRDYMRKLAIDRSYNGYTAAFDLVATQLERELGVSIEGASDEWDRTYGVDLVLSVPGAPLGVQVKPDTFSGGTDTYAREAQLDAAHTRFRADTGGSVYTIVYNKKEKRIKNPEVVAALQIEIDRRRGSR